MRQVIVIFLALFAAVALGEALQLDEAGFDAQLSAGGPFLAAFTAPWCGHCKRLHPELDAAAGAFKRFSKQVALVNVDCDANAELCGRYEVRGYPTLKWFPGNGAAPVDYSAGRTQDDIVNFVNEKTGLKGRIGKQVSACVDLTDDSFLKVVTDESTVTLAEFYAPWCGHCKNLAPIYEKLCTAFANEPSVTIARIDADAHKKHSGNYGVTGFPTLKFFGDDKENPETYSGGRTLDELVDYINEQAGTQRNADGSLSDSAGVLEELADVVARFKADPSGQVESAVNAAKGASAEYEGKVYARAFTSTAKDAGYPAKEAARLQRMIDSGSLTGAKVDEFTKRINILNQF